MQDTIPSELPGVALTGVEIRPMSASFAPDTPESVVEDSMRRNASDSRGSAFRLADAINHEIKHGRERWEAWEEMTGIPEKELRNIARVGRKIRPDLRKDQFTFDFYRPIAALPEAEQEHWIEVAEREHLTKGELRKSIIAGEVKRASAPSLADSGKENVIPLVSKLDALLEGMEQSGTLDGVMPFMLYNLHADLLPVLKHHANIVRRLARTGDKDAMRDVRNDLAELHRA